MYARRVFDTERLRVQAIRTLSGRLFQRTLDRPDRIYTGIENRVASRERNAHTGHLPPPRGRRRGRRARAGHSATRLSTGLRAHRRLARRKGESAEHSVSQDTDRELYRVKDPTLCRCVRVVVDSCLVAMTYMSESVLEIPPRALSLSLSRALELSLCVPKYRATGAVP